MKLYCAGEPPKTSCLVLKINHVVIMFDCGVDWAPFLHFLPSHPSLDVTRVGSNGNSSSATTAGTTTVTSNGSLKGLFCLLVSHRFACCEVPLVTLFLLMYDNQS